LLNWAARYYPITRILRANGFFDKGSLLEIGSGSVGIGKFRPVPFVGCDIAFASKPVWPMIAVVASAADLPMSDCQFDVVVASDVLEHIPLDLRNSVISETLRVARYLVIFGFPSSDAAWQLDKSLMQYYERRHVIPPDWLKEHMDAPFPGADLFQNLDGWSVEQFGNESLRFHGWLMRREMCRPFVRACTLWMQIAPRIVETVLKWLDREPNYRQIFVLKRTATPTNSDRDR
jgi:hypothetical protein